MSHQLLKVLAVGPLLALAACGGGGSSTPTAAAVRTSAPASPSPAAATSAGTSASGGPAWQVVSLIDDQVNDGGIPHTGNSTVDGIAFTSLDHGVVALSGADATSQLGGAIEELTGPTTVSSIVFPGFGKGPDQQNLDVLGLERKGDAVVALSGFGEEFIASIDGGHTWTETPLSKPDGPNIAQVWLEADTKGTWHLMDDVGNVWQTPGLPGATATWTRTWQPEGSDPDPAELPKGACPNSFHQTYYAKDSQQGFWASSDGQTMMYPNGLKDFPAGVCRSTDGGHDFQPVAFPDPPAAGALTSPYVITFFDDQHGFAARANDLVPGSAYAYTTADGGATWAKASLPDSVSTKANITTGFTAPDGKTAWLAGFGDSKPLLLRSDDAGATWTDISAGVQAALADASGNAVKLHTGFALDATHLWLGGEKGTLVYSSTGGL